MKNIKYNLFFIFISILLLSNKIECIAQKIKLHSIVQQTIDDDKKQAIEVWEKFLYSLDEVARRELWDANETNKFGNEYSLFEQAFFQYDREETLKFFTPYVLNIEYYNDALIITTMFSYFPLSISDSSIKNQNPAAIVKIAVIKKNNRYYLKNVLDYKTEYWRNYLVGHINYIVHPSIEPLIEDMNSANNFIDSLSNLWCGHNYKDTINYYMAPNSETINDIIGFQFAYLGSIGGGQAFVDAKLLFSGRRNFFYKHELAHIVFGKFQNTMFSEGLATFFGGSNNIDYLVLKNKFLNKIKINNYNDLLSFFSHPNSFEYYMIGAIIIEKIFTTKGIDIIKEISTLEKGTDSINGAELFINKVKEKLDVDDDAIISLFK